MLFLLLKRLIIRKEEIVFSCEKCDDRIVMQMTEIEIEELRKCYPLALVIGKNDSRYQLLKERKCFKCLTN